MKYLTTVLTLTLFISTLFGQDESLEYQDKIYLDNIKTVKIYKQGNVLSAPIVTLNASDKIVLNFDDMEPEYKDYIYTFVHCDANWQPSDIEELDYMDGFADQEIEDYESSDNTYVPFVNYNLVLPNRDVTWTVSGNYLLKIYEDEDEKRLAITRRFMVVEPMMSVSGTMMPPSNVAKFKTHQELDFSVNLGSTRIQNQKRDIKVVVMQNRRWETAMTELQPLFQRKNELVYDYQDKVIFPAGKEFRWVDFRTLDYKGNRVASVESFSDGYIVTTLPDIKRGYRVFFHNPDANGNFVVQNVDRLRRQGVQFSAGSSNTDNDFITTRGGGSYSLNVDNLESDYADVRFMLESPTSIDDADVYLYGAFSDWQIKEEFKMTYSDVSRAYNGEVLLKQGYYEYVYAVVPKGSDKVDIEMLEGNWYETENEYTVLVYYSPVSSRYTKLAAVGKFNSVRQ